ETTTDSKGRFRFESTSEHELKRVEVLLPEQPATRQQLGSWSPGEENAVLQLRGPRRDPSRMRITVVDGLSGEPIEEPTVSDWEGNPLPDLTTAERGIIEVPRTFISDGPIGYLVSADGYGRVPIIYPYHIGTASRVEL